jgi:transposase
LTEREWALTAPFIPPAKTGGRRRSTDMREVLNALKAKLERLGRG